MTPKRLRQKASRRTDPKSPLSKITALAGGVGASKLLLGLYDVLPDPSIMTAIVNTGDDIILHGLKISPDLDIVTYTLAGLIDPKKGWGFRGETFHLLKRLAVFGRVNWFNLGDRDLATHIHRTALLAEGKTLTDATESIRTALGVKSPILPMANEPIPTIIQTDGGDLHFQEYLVKRRAEPIVRGIRFEGVEKSQPAAGVLEAIREALRARRADVTAICPIVGGKSLKGPSDKMLAQLGHDPSAQAVAKLYADFSATFVIDPADESQANAIQALGMNVVVVPTVMQTRTDKRKLARALLTI